MKRLYWITFTLLVTLNQLVWAQDASFENYYLNALEEYKDKNYENALYFFDKALKIKPRNADANYYAGICYIELVLNKEALTSLEKVESDQLSDPVNYNYWLAEANYRNERFEQARHYLNRYLQQKKTPRRNLAEKLTDYIDRAQDFYGQAEEFSIDNMGEKVNTADHEFAPSVDPLGKTFLFSREQEGVGSPLKNTYQPNRVTAHTAFFTGDGTLEEAYRIEEIIFSGGKTFILNMLDYSLMGNYKQALVSQQGKMYLAKYNNGEWGMMPLHLDSEGQSAEAVHATISEDRKRLVLSMMTKKDGLDLFEMIYDKATGGWSAPQPIAELNSEKDEITPFLQGYNGNTLYFSSTGHGVVAERFDIFRSVRDTTTGVWSAPENLRYPINTTSDEAYFVIKDGKGYFSSNRDGGFGGADLYKIYTFRNFKLRGSVYDRYLEKEVPNCEIRLLEAGTTKGIDTVFTNERGYYEVPAIPANKPIDIFLLYEDKLLYVEEFRSVGRLIMGKQEHELVHNFHVQTTKEGLEKAAESEAPDYIPFRKPEIGSRFILKTVKFRSGTTELLPDSREELDRFADFLKANPELPTIEIGGHTDNVGDPTANLRLSERRAKAVLSYLTTYHDLPEERFTTKGYGETQPIASNDDEKEGRELNRRIEAKLVEK